MVTVLLFRLKKTRIGNARNATHSISDLGHKINIGYQNGLVLNSLPFTTKAGRFTLANAPHWDAEMIEARTKLLVDMVANANLLPGEKPGKNYHLA